MPGCRIHILSYDIFIYYKDTKYLLYMKARIKKILREFNMEILDSEPYKDGEKECYKSDVVYGDISGFFFFKRPYIFF